MFVVVSPAKKMHTQPLQTTAFSEPVFSVQTKELVAVMRVKSSEELKKLMAISDSLAELNVQRFANYSFEVEEGQQALALFAGDTYVGLNAEKLTATELEYAQAHLGILSGLYGVLAPLDRIQPYRLEMGTRLETRKGKNLYQFWGDEVTDEVVSRMGEQRYLINLASTEYFSVLNAQRLSTHFAKTIVTPVFKEIDKKHGTGEMKIISFNAKRARGMMARYIIQKQIVTPTDLCAFNLDGYLYREELSSETEPVFVR